MPDLRLALTDRAIASLQLASSGQYFARDTELPGFMVLVGKRWKTFVVQGERKQDKQRLSVRMKLAEVGELTTRTARAKAKDILGKIANGIDPRTSTRQADADIASLDLPSIADPTLRYAWERYRDGHMKKKGRSDGSVCPQLPTFGIGDRIPCNLMTSIGCNPIFGRLEDVATGAG